MKTIADLTVKQLYSLARIAMLHIERRVVFLADSPKEVFKEQVKDSMDPYAIRILLKLLPDLNAGKTPVILDSDEPGLMLVKATWCGIQSYGLHAFFAASKHPDGFGSFKTQYLLDSIHDGDYVLYERAGVLAALKLYVSLIEDFYASDSSKHFTTDKSSLINVRSHYIGDYWDNVLACRHLGKDPIKWSEHLKNNKPGAA